MDDMEDNVINDVVVWLCLFLVIYEISIWVADKKLFLMTHIQHKNIAISQELAGIYFVWIQPVVLGNKMV